MRDFQWNEQNETQLKALVASGGLSAAEIAKQIGTPSRSSVLSKIHRLGLRLGNSTRTPMSAQERAERRNAGKRERRARASATIGQVRRIRRQRDPEANLSEVERRMAAESRRIAMSCEAVDLTPEQRATAKTLLKLSKGDCRWPYGDPAKPDFIFCGAPVAAERSYCPAHCRMAYQVV